MSGLTEIKNEIIFCLNNHKSAKLTRTLARFLKNRQFSLQEKSDIIGELTIKDPTYLMNVIMPRLQGLIRKWAFSDLVKMDKIIFKKANCLIEGEDIIAIFYGRIVDKKTTTSGRIYLTNYRLLACGNQVVRSAQKSVGYSGLISTLVRSGITSHRMAVRRAITQAFRKDLAEWNLGEWGYYFPIYKAINIKRGKNSISYTLELETEKKPISLKITITPVKVKQQSKDQFATQKEYVLNQIEQKLNEYK
ncbi:MAG: hypothetical protein ACFFBT_07460 [Promethearchaeota archaeon]